MSYGKIMMAIENRNVKVITEAMNSLLRNDEFDLFNEAQKILDECRFYITFYIGRVRVSELRHVARP